MVDIINFDILKKELNKGSSNSINWLEYEKNYEGLIKEVNINIINRKNLKKL
jgi:hypothetical protein